MASERGLVQSLDRALTIVEVLRFSDGDLPLGEVAGRAGLAKSTAHRLLSTLESRGYVVHDPVGGGYRLSARRIAPLAAGGAMRAILAELAEGSGETANLGVLAGSEVLYVARVESPHALRWELGVGSRIPTHCTGLGKAILSRLAPVEVRRRLPRRLAGRTERSITEVEPLLEELAAVRARGYALDEEEFMEGVRCVAVPVPGGDVGAPAALSLAGPAFRFTAEAAAAEVERLRAAAGRIGALLEDTPQSLEPFARSGAGKERT